MYQNAMPWKELSETPLQLKEWWKLWKKTTFDLCDVICDAWFLVNWWSPSPQNGGAFFFLLKFKSSVFLSIQSHQNRLTNMNGVCASGHVVMSTSIYKALQFRFLENGSVMLCLWMWTWWHDHSHEPHCRFFFLFIFLDIDETRSKKKVFMLCKNVIPICHLKPQTIATYATG